MKLMVCIADKKYGAGMIQRLSNKGYRVTKLASTGGFLKEGNDTLLIGVRNDDIDVLKSAMKEAVVEIEQQKGWKPKEHRFTSFIVTGHNFLPGKEA